MLSLSPTELSLIVVGEKKSGKTSVCSSLLGYVDTPQGQRHVTCHCVKHTGHLRGIKLTVVDTPGWWKDYPLTDTAERTKQELQLSVRYCHPGPQAFILTVEIDHFTKKSRRAVEEHLGLFGENIWSHTIVVFTKGESLRDKSIEQHIANEGEPLKWVLEKCGSRYCVHKRETKDQNQVFQLLEMIQNEIVSNSRRYFVFDEDILKEVEERKRAAQERATSRQLKVEETSKLIKEKGK